MHACMHARTYECIQVMTEDRKTKAWVYLFLEYYPIQSGEATLPEGIKPGVDILWQVFTLPPLNLTLQYRPHPPTTTQSSKLSPRR